MEPVFAASTFGQEPPPPRPHRSGAGRPVVIAAAATAGIAGATLLAWALEFAWQPRFIPALTPMAPFTALLLLVTVVPLVLLADPAASRRRVVIGRSVALVVGAFGLVTFGEYALGYETEIERLLFYEAVVAFPVGEAGRLAPNTTIAFVLTALALLSIDLNTRRVGNLGQLFAILAALLAGMAVIGHAYGLAALYEVVRYAPMALPTALSFVAVSTGILFARPDRGLMAVVTGQDVGGYTARRLLPVAVLLPVLVGFILLVGRRAGFWGIAFVPAAAAIATIVAFAGLVIWNAAVLRQLDAARREVERGREYQRTLLEAVAQAVPAGIIFLSPGGRILYHNRRFAQLWRMPDEVLRAGTLDAAVHWAQRQVADPEALRASVSATFAAPPRESRAEIILRDGRIFDRFGGPVRGADGELVGWILTFLDVTAQRRAVESRARLIRGFSHDLKNPLGAADGHAALLADGIDGPLAPAQQARLGRIRSSLAAAVGLVDDLVELARVESGKISIERRPTDLRAEARAVAEEHRARAESKGLGLRVELDQVPIIEVDPARVRQILGNLVVNAVKYTGSGWVVVHTAVREGGDAPGAGRWAVVEVVDTGPGIPREMRTRIFEEFIRLAPGTDQPGAGLGLAISQRLARALGGDLTVDSRDDRGSRFTLWLPIREARRIG